MIAVLEITSLRRRSRSSPKLEIAVRDLKQATMTEMVLLQRNIKNH